MGTVEYIISVHLVHWIPILTVECIIFAHCLPHKISILILTLCTVIYSLVYLSSFIYIAEKEEVDA